MRYSYNILFHPIDSLGEAVIIGAYKETIQQRKETTMQTIIARTHRGVAVPPPPMHIANSYDKVCEAMKLGQRVHFVNSSGRLFPSVIINGIAREDGSGKSFVVTILYTNAGVSTNRNEHVRFPA